MSSRAFISSVVHRHGTWHPIEDLAPDEAQHLRTFGLRRYSVLQPPARDYYVECVQQVLAQTGVEPAAVGAVVFFTSTFESYTEYDDLAALAHTAGLHNALPLGLTLGQCTNYSTALLTAQNLIATSGIDNVLLLGADILDERRAPRVLGGRLSVFSDCVACGLVSREDHDGYALGAIRHHYLPRMHEISPERDILGFLKGFSEGLKSACKATYEAEGITAAEIDWLVPANLNLQVLRNFAALAGVPMERTFTRNVERMGHSFAYDQLIALSTLVEEQAVRSADRLLLIGIGGNYLFSAVALTKT